MIALFPTPSSRSTRTFFLLRTRSLSSRSSFSLPINTRVPIVILRKIASPRVATRRFPDPWIRNEPTNYLFVKPPRVPIPVRVVERFAPRAIQPTRPALPPDSRLQHSGADKVPIRRDRPFGPSDLPPREE